MVAPAELRLEGIDQQGRRGPHFCGDEQRDENDPYHLSVVETLSRGHRQPSPTERTFEPPWIVPSFFTRRPLSQWCSARHIPSCRLRP